MCLSEVQMLLKSALHPVSSLKGNDHCGKQRAVSSEVYDNLSYI